MCSRKEPCAIRGRDQQQHVIISAVLCVGREHLCHGHGDLVTCPNTCWQRND